MIVQALFGRFPWGPWKHPRHRLGLHLQRVGDRSWWVVVEADICASAERGTEPH